ncbi:MAG: uracil phosphoribosyltransferase, partial [Candidatus Caldarchaeum sp.]
SLGELAAGCGHDCIAYVVRNGEFSPPIFTPGDKLEVELDQRDVFLVVADPMVATGSTILKVLAGIEKRGTPKRIILATIISTMQAIDRVRPLQQSRGLHRRCGLRVERAWIHRSRARRRGIKVFRIKHIPWQLLSVLRRLDGFRRRPSRFMAAAVRGKISAARQRWRQSIPVGPGQLLSKPLDFHRFRRR